MHRIAVMAAAILVMPLMMSCGSVAVDTGPGEGPGPLQGGCVAGETQVCVCTVDGEVREGSQTCMPNGQGWNPCACATGGEVPGGLCGDAICDAYETELTCMEDCYCGDSVCDEDEASDDSCPEDCGSACVPMCANKECGGDSCGGTCGNCGADEECRVEAEEAWCVPALNCGDGNIVAPIEECECWDGSFSCSAEQGSEDNSIVTNGGASSISNTWCTDISPDFQGGRLWCDDCGLDTSECY